MGIAFGVWIFSTLFSVWAGAYIGNTDYFRLRRFIGSPYYDGPMWAWFGLSYAAYLVMPRSLICGMPLMWQEHMEVLLKQYHAAYDWSHIDDNYSVQTRGLKGRFYPDPLANYKYPPPLPYKHLIRKGKP